MVGSGPEVMRRQKFGWRGRTLDWYRLGRRRGGFSGDVIHGGGQMAGAFVRVVGGAQGGNNRAPASFPTFGACI